MYVSYVILYQLAIGTINLLKASVLLKARDAHRDQVYEKQHDL